MGDEKADSDERYTEDSWKRAFALLTADDVHGAFEDADTVLPDRDGGSSVLGRLIEDWRWLRKAAGEGPKS